MNEDNQEVVVENDTVSELNHEIQELKQEIHTHNTKSRVFWNGIISGLGRTIGATIVFGLLITIISYAVRHSDASWIQTLVDWVGLDSYLK